MVKLAEQQRIKNKIKKIDSLCWCGDDFDVRFYLINKLKLFQKKIVLDVGGGIGIIGSEMIYFQHLLLINTHMISF